MAAGSDEVRFVRAAGLVDPTAIAASRPRTEPAVRRTAHAQAATTAIPPDLAAPLRRIESDDRAIVSRPIEGWDLTGVRRDDQALLAARADDPSRPAVRQRLTTVDRDDEMAKTAHEFEAIVRTSRQRDTVLAQVRDALRDVRVAEDLAYDAEGLLQPTSRLVDGEKVFALLNREGRVVTYVKIPAGVETKTLVARQVGVRGKSRFDEQLKFRLLDARDVDPLVPD